RLGPQHPPIPGVHNSVWVQAPAAAVLDDPKQYARLEAYVEDIVGTFAKDDRARLGRLERARQFSGRQRRRLPRRAEGQIPTRGNAAAAGFRLGAQPASDSASHQRALAWSRLEQG